MTIQVRLDVPPVTADTWSVAMCRRTPRAHPKSFPNGGIWDYLQGTCTEHRAPNREGGAPWTQVVQGNNKLHFMVKGFYLSPCHCELIEKIISPHNASLMKSDGALVTRCQPF